MRISRPSLFGITILTLFFFMMAAGKVFATVTAHYETDPTLCPDEDVQFPGQKCPAGLGICGVDNSNIPQCYDMSLVTAPIATATSTTQYSASFGGGYIINCFTQPLDSVAPYCDNDGAWLCNRDSSCYSAPTNKLTTCTGAGTFSCGACRSGYQDCDAEAGTCEVQTNVTDYPTGAHNNYGAICAAQCDTNYLDCDGEGIGNTDGCEINNGGACDTHAVYNGCSGGLGNCQCSSTYYDCNSDLGLGGDGCEIHNGDACTTGGVSGTYSGCTCIPTKSYFETGTESTYGSGDPLLWGTQLGTGSLMSFSNAVGEVFSVGNSGAIVTSGGLTASGAIKTESGITLNKDNAAQDAVLVFGNALGAETLKFLDTEHRFEFSDELYVEGNLSTSGSLAVMGETVFQSGATVQGDLTVTGLINGVDITALSSASDDTHLHVSTGAGLTVEVAAGDYRIDGVLIHYNGENGIGVQASTTNYLYMSATGVLVTPVGFPTDKSFIPLATVTTSPGAVTGITDRRALSSDDRQDDFVLAYHPGFDGASYLGDGSDNIGRLYVTDQAGVDTNYYVWTSTRSTLQDYDITLRATVPHDFLGWKDPALQVSYVSDTADSADNQLDLSVYDTAGNLVTLSGSALDLAATEWTTSNLECAAGATWTAGEDFRVVFHLSAKGDHSMGLGTVKLWMQKLLGI
ncbi:MAG: hypothetical protein PHO20_01500 [Candidatus Peribacteraceae bacterium]|nr:hypothetical protein [Candidatus Peribacteraceae bacterium]MDD5739424.1 hypothetical protein [Candidatus Peribacteraceae bacterium]